jgi:hypothetical protein
MCITAMKTSATIGFQILTSYHPVTTHDITPSPAVLQNLSAPNVRPILIDLQISLAKIKATSATSVRENAVALSTAAMY